ncbi:hypothetical protein F4815DRAFT_445017 [Daldinia loculata]|nr:hypothetical protein F4815DRAFT_445017 [Daldinia loculata]
MSFSTLPNELVQEILIAAVRVRVSKCWFGTSSVERALRLRLVSRLWDTVTMYAMFQSGILNDPSMRFPYICRPFWSRYLTDKLMCTATPLTRPLLIIRQVAERILAFRGEDTWGEKLEEVIFEISKVCMNTNDHYGGSYVTWTTPPSRNAKMSTKITDRDEDFMQALLAAAAFTNEVKLVKELLPHFRQSPYLISPPYRCDDTPSFGYPLLGYPLELAAFKGNVEIVHIFLDFITEANVGQGLQEEVGRNIITRHGTKKNNIAMIELGLDPNCWYEDSEQYLLYTFSLTTSVDTFKRLHQLYKECILDGKERLIHDESLHNEEFLLNDEWIIEYEKPPDYANSLTRLSVLLKLICCFAAAGNIPLIEHVIQLCRQLGLSVEGLNKSKKYRLCGPLGGPAGHGHLSTIVYLLETGFKADRISILQAVRHGNLRIVRLLLENVVHHIVDWGGALLQAVRGENESVFRLLVEFGAPLDEWIENEGLRIAEREGLESMVNLIREYEWEIPRLEFIENVE